MAVENLDHLEAYYALALQFEDYRAGAYYAIRAMRTRGRMEPWKTRLRGCMTRRFQ